MEADRQRFSRCPVLGVIFSFLQQRQRQQRRAEKRRSATTVCPALCALRLGEPSHTSNALLLPSLPQLVYSVRHFCLCYDLPDAALLRRRSFLWLCLHPSLPGKGREVMEVGEAAAAAGDGGLGAHIDLCHFSVSLSPLHLFAALSLHFTSHYTHMHARTHIDTHTHMHTKVWENYTRLRHQGEETSICFLSRTGTSTEPKQPPTVQQASQHLQTPPNSKQLSSSTT